MDRDKKYRLYGLTNTSVLAESQSRGCQEWLLPDATVNSPFKVHHTSTFFILLKKQGITDWHQRNGVYRDLI